MSNVSPSVYISTCIYYLFRKAQKHTWPRLRGDWISNVALVPGMHRQSFEAHTTTGLMRHQRLFKLSTPVTFHGGHHSSIARTASHDLTRWRVSWSHACTTLSSSLHSNATHSLGSIWPPKAPYVLINRIAFLAGLQTYTVPYRQLFTFFTAQ